MSEIPIAGKEILIPDISGLEKLFYGSSLLSCGGGYAINTSIAEAEKFMRSKNVLRIAPISSFSDSDILCSAYSIGTSEQDSLDGEIFLEALRKLEGILGQRIAGIIPGEIGSEVCAASLCVRQSLPLVDTDIVGGRAVPEAQMDSFTLHDLSAIPLVAANKNRQVLIIDHVNDARELEEKLRRFSIESNSDVHVVGNSITAGEARSVLTEGTVSRSLRVGELLLNQRPKSIESLINGLRPITGQATRDLFTGRVISFERKSNLSFLSGRIHIVDKGKQNSLEILVQNENIIVWKNGNVVASAPDLITLVDANRFLPIHNSQIEANQEVVVLGIPALFSWRTPRGIELLGPRAFGYNFEYKPLESSKFG